MADAETSPSPSPSSSPPTPPPPPQQPSSHWSQYPTIDPTTFDLIVCGTGLPESLLAAAAASAAKSVLHLDPNPFYGSHFSSLSLLSYASFLHPSDSDRSSPLAAADEDSCGDDAAVDLRRRSLYSEVETSGSFPEPSRGFLLDLAGPRVLYCSDAMVDLLLRSGASNHVEFKSVDATLIYWEGKLCPVPDTREAIFRDRTLGLAEKSQMTKFLRLIQSHIASEQSVNGEEQGAIRIPPEDLEVPFAIFLRSKKLPPKIRAMILYAITFANYDQEDAESCKKLIMTKDGIESLSLYTKSVARFANAVGAFIYPMYGHGELPQSFCRCAAVKGALYVLRMPLTALVVDKETGRYKGVRLASGQDVFSHKMVMEPSFEIPPSVSPTNAAYEESKASSFSRKVAKGICITAGSILPDSSNVLVIFPPKSLFPEQSTAVRVLQLSQNVAVCPPGFLVVYLSTPCDDAMVGKECINAAINTLFLVPEVDTSESNSLSEEQNKPALKWSMTCVQEQEQGSSGVVYSCPMPDENLDYASTLEITKTLFATMYPEMEFFPAAQASDNTEEDESLPD